jgi:hypothetical protein
MAGHVSATPPQSFKKSRRFMIPLANMRGADAPL